MKKGCRRIFKQRTGKRPDWSLKEKREGKERPGEVKRAGKEN